MPKYVMPNANPDEISKALGRWSDEYFAVQPELSYRVPNGFQVLAESEGSSDRSRALEMYNLGLLRGVINPTQEGGRSQMPLGWNLLSNDQAVHTELGYLAYLLGRASEGSENYLIKAGVSALSAIYTIQCYIELKDGTRFSCLGLFEWLKRKFVTERNLNPNDVLRHLAAAMFCTLKHEKFGEDLATAYIVDDPAVEPELMLIWPGKIVPFNKFNFLKVVLENPSVTNVTPVKPSLYWCGLRGVYSQASRNCKPFLKEFAEEEVRRMLLNGYQPDALFRRFFEKDTGQETVNIMSLVKELGEIPSMTSSVKQLMINLREGALEAVKQLYGEKAVAEATPPPRPASLPTDLPYQKILFGPPGTGKSHTAEKDTENFIVKRTTFHPDADFVSFVGSYKPHSVGANIEYTFRPQIFAETYLAAWLDPEKAYFLLIEEINRGNCAQIFGDLFQSLDRNKHGFSRYAVKADTDLANWFHAELSKDPLALARYEAEVTGRKLVGNDWIILPRNLYLWATMNTSDQSLFPMDSAFKRRWDWQYIPINLKDAKEVTIDLGTAGKYNWGDFIEVVNKKIYELLQSEDKQLGNRFVNPTGKPRIISIGEFKAKVLFYLWSEIYKLETESTESIFFYQPADPSAQKERFTFANLYESDADTRILPSFMQALVNQIPAVAASAITATAPEEDSSDESSADEEASAEEEEI